MVTTHSTSNAGRKSHTSTHVFTASVTRGHSTVAEHASGSMQGRDCFSDEGVEGWGSPD